MISKTNETIRQKLKNHKVIAIDMDGTIYMGQELFPFTKEFLKGLEVAKKDYIFFTNNSSKNNADYYDKLSELGLEIKKHQIYSSGDATIEYLKKVKPGAKIYLLGTNSLAEDFGKAGFKLDEVLPDFVVLGFDLDFTYSRFEKAARFIRNGVTFIATHPDFNCPIEGSDMIPDCGSLAAAFTAATGVIPKVIGKPNQEMLEGILKRTKIKKEELSIMGDRMMTDIKMGKNFGIFSILVLTGETKIFDLENAEFQPDLVLEKNIDLLKYL